MGTKIFIKSSLVVFLIIVSTCTLKKEQETGQKEDADNLKDQTLFRRERRIRNGDGLKQQTPQISIANATSNAIASGGSTAISNSTALSLPQNLGVNGAAVAIATATATAVASDGSTAIASSQAIAVSPVLAGRFIAGEIEFDIDDYSIFMIGCNENKANINYNQKNKQFQCQSFDQNFNGCDHRYRQLGSKLSKTKKILFKDNIFSCKDENNNELFTFRRENGDERLRQGFNLRNHFRKQRRFIRNRLFNPYNFWGK